jgi:hypothetical protein
MPTISADQRKAARRELAKSRRRGDTITCDGGPAVMIVDGKRVVMMPAPSEAERKAEADRVWRKSCGPW